MLSAALPTMGVMTPRPSRRKVRKPATPVVVVSTSRRALVLSVALGSVRVCAMESVAREVGHGSLRSLRIELRGTMPMKTPRLAETTSQRNICRRSGGSRCPAP
jgi:hypothetical protein